MCSVINVYEDEDDVVEFCDCVVTVVPIIAPKTDLSLGMKIVAFCSATSNAKTERMNLTGQ